MQLSRHHVVISNQWHRPAIKVQVHWDPDLAPKGGIQLEISLTDFIEGVIQELEKKNRRIFWRKRAMREQIEDAVRHAVEKVKESSVYRPNVYVPVIKHD